LLNMKMNADTDETSTTNKADMTGRLEVEKDPVAFWELSATGTSDEWTGSMKIRDGDNTEVVRFDTSMPKSGDHYAGDINLMLDGKNEGAIRSSISTGFLQQADGKDKLDMAIHLGATGTKGFSEAGGNVNWFIERGPRPTRDISRFGVGGAAFEMINNQNKKPNSGAEVQTEIGMPYRVNPLPGAASVTTFDTAVTMDDPSQFDAAKYKETVALESGATADKVEIVSVKYEVDVKLSFDEPVTKQQAKAGVASTAGVTEDKVTVTLTTVAGGGRRLLEELERSLPGFKNAPARRLQKTLVDAKIETDAPAKAKTIATNVGDSNKIKTGMTAQGVQSAPKVVTAPKESVKVQTKITSAPGSKAISKPSATKLQQSLSTKLGVTVTTKVGSAAVSQSLKACSAPAGITNVASGGACSQGATVYAGSTCTAQCNSGYSPSVASLSCQNSGAFSPTTFTCQATSTAGVTTASGANAQTLGCIVAFLSLFAMH
jgi:hypothetical protein